MDEKVDIYQKLLNSLYISLSRTAGTLPFSGRYWLEEITRGVGEQVLDDYGQEMEVVENKPAAICRAYLGALDQTGIIREKDYQLEEDGESVVVTMSRSRCVYQEFCLIAEEDGLFFYCPRLGALQAALKRILGVEYSTAVSIDKRAEKCRGRIFPTRLRLKTEMVTREGDLLKISGERAVLFTKDMYAFILLAIKEYAPHIMKAALFDAGYRSSRIIAEQAKNNYTDPLDALDSLFGELSNVGLGKVELISLEPGEGYAVIRCYNSMEVAIALDFPLNRTPRVVCDLIRGKLSAYLSVMLERPIICEELQCSAMGVDFCEFHAFPAEEGVVK